MRKIIKATLPLICLLLSPLVAKGQTFYSESVDTVSGLTPQTVTAVEKIAGKGNPKIGLVLSGGGAKGIAHIGVIKALEENDIPIDCIAGTSMGAVVGGLYSCGYSPEAMMDLVTSKVFLNCSTGTIDNDLIYYFSKQMPTPEWLSVNLSLRADSASSGIAGQLIPSSLINPLPMNMEFLRLFTKYTVQCNKDFNNLFVPFRCVCSDVYNKHKVVLHSGSVGNAVRASMSFPTVFRPIEIDGLLMYDGGIYDNFPVDVMQKDFNPDFIIGVSVSGADAKPQPGNLMEQLEDMIIQNNNYSVPSENGIKIQVPVLKFGVLDFGQAKTIYNIGYQTGLAMVDSIKKRISVRRSPEIVAERREVFNNLTPAVEFNKVEVTGASPGQSRYLRFLFTRGLYDRPFGMEQTQDAFYRAISAEKLTNLLPFALLNEPKRGENTLLLQSTVKNPWSVGVGGWVTTTTQSMLYLRLGYHTLSYNSLDIDLSGWVGQSYYAGMLAGKFTIHSRVPAYMKFEGVMGRQKYYDSQLMFFQNASPLYISEIENYVKIKYCLATSRKSIASASFGYGYTSDKYYTDSEMSRKGIYDNSRYRTLALRLDWEYNTLDNDMYPMSGRMLDGNIIIEREEMNFIPNREPENATGYKSQYAGSAEIIWKGFYPLHRHFRLGGMAQGLMSLRKLRGEYTSQMIHTYAFAPTPSTKNLYNPYLRSDNFVACGLIPIWNPADKFQIRGDFYGFLPVRNITANADGMAIREGWLKDPQFIGQLAGVYNFSFASLTIYGNYLSTPGDHWHFGIGFGLFFQAPRFTR